MLSQALWSERHHEIIMALIRFHIGTAEPVGSKTLVERCRLNVSPATVRSVLAELEDEGYLSQPYTSAGRVPTEKAYRYYVDNLLEQRFSDNRVHAKHIQLALREFSGGVEDLLKWTSRVLSDMSRYAGIVIPPRRLGSLFKKVTFVRISRERVLTVLVSVSGVTRNKLVHTGEDLSQKALDSMSSYLNQRFSGLSLDEMRGRVEKDLEQDLESFDLWMKSALHLGKRMFDGPDSDEVYVEGGSRFLDMPEFMADMESMRGIFRLFEEKRGLVALLDQTIKAKDMMVFIGSETGITEMKGLSLVVSTYGRETGPLGAVGVMGPSRMDYNQVIPLVRSAAEAVSENFTNTDNPREGNI
jgi:heat-inducible transcriptional repressor